MVSSRGWNLSRGATLLADGSVEFRVWAPFRNEVSVCLQSPAGQTFELTRNEQGLFSGIVPAVNGVLDYTYILDRKLERPDPVSRYQPSGVHGPSRLVSPEVFQWSDQSWTGREIQDCVFYELHVGTFSSTHDFIGATQHFEHLAKLGVTAIELMPVAQFPGSRNWGYDGVALYAPQNSYGGPEGLRQFVDQAHAYGLAVVLDVVYNHLGPEGNYLADFGPYFTEEHETAWGRAINFESTEVRRYFIDNARYWIKEFHLDGLRLDAVHAIYDWSTPHILEELSTEVRALGTALGRKVVVIAESDSNDPKIIRSRSRDGFGLDAQWSDDFHHASHAALTGERHGYYEDFGGITQLNEAFRQGFVFQGQYSLFRKQPHGKPVGDLPPCRFVACLQNHDQVGNREQGERLVSLVGWEKGKLAAALCLLSPYVPLLFMGEEYGETNPFLYFIDHQDLELRRAVSQGRQREFAQFQWSSETPDPGALETFSRSVLDWERLDQGRHQAMLRLYRELISLRKLSAIKLSDLRRHHVEVIAPEQGLLVHYEQPGKHSLLVIFHFGVKPTAYALPELKSRANWEQRFSTLDERYLPENPQTLPHRIAPSTREITLPPLSATAYLEH